MADVLNPEQRKRNMQAIRATRTSIEEKVTRDLWTRGFRFRKNVPHLFGKPDIAIQKYKLVIFIDSCFWHGCKLHGNVPRTNEAFWLRKLARNAERDQEVLDYYQNRRWSVLRVWEHEIRKDYDKTLEKMIEFIEFAKYAYQYKKTRHEREHAETDQADHHTDAPKAEQS